MVTGHEIMLRLVASQTSSALTAAAIISNQCSDHHSPLTITLLPFHAPVSRPIAPDAAAVPLPRRSKTMPRGPENILHIRDKLSPDRPVRRENNLSPTRRTRSAPEA